MRNKLRLTILTIIVLAITLTVGTYAWLQLNSVNILQGLEFKTTGGDQLELSLDGKAYSKELNQKSLEDKIRNSKFSDVTTSDGKTFYHGLSSELAKPGKHYISFDMHFRVKPSGTEKNENEVMRYIYLIDKVNPEFGSHESVEGTYAVSKGVNWTSPITFNNGDDIINKGERRTYHATEALRIGFSNDTHGFIYDVSENEQRGFGKSFGALDYYNQMKKETLTPPEKPETTYKLTQMDPYRPYEASNDDSLIAELKKETDGYYYGKTTISIWIEGWDADSFDAIIHDKVFIQLKFRALRRSNIQ